jgi:ubiquinone/menaquinone biosynthesis C-methylase UbiE/DNA-binding transcriptional ArsR family regulator
MLLPKTSSPPLSPVEPADPSESTGKLSLEELLAGLKSAGEPTRLRLLAILREAELTVTELTQILGQSQPRVSRHLKLMCGAGLLDRFSEGTWAFYRLAERGEGARLARTLIDLLPTDDETLARDIGRLEAVKHARADEAAAYFRAVATDWHQVRALHVPEAEVEAAMLDFAGNQEIGQLLDVGTGTGRILELFGGLIRRGIGIDLNHEMLSIARANLERSGLSQCQVRQGDMYSLPLGDNSVDMAVIHQVLHYVDGPSAVIAEAARVLQPGGRLMIVDFAPHELERLRTDHAHRRLGFSDREMGGWCQRAGLQPEPVRHLFGGELTVSLWLAYKNAASADGNSHSEEGAQ